ncbi:MAG: ABC-type transport auxiliary lipoprotein family protein [Pseudomonadota bacterium]|nr:ABC-type transport auxiliary lipoprotein family protein [Pseudomonadota bacterium]
MPLRLIPVLLLTALSTACSILPTPPPTALLHDFGPPPEQTSTAPCRLELRVSAPAWLDSGAIHYRYAGDTQLAAYRDHRWAAAPSALLAQRIAALLAPADIDAPTCRLDVHVTGFEQHFLASGDSEARLFARASLVTQHDGKVIHEIDFSVREPTATADVQGGIPALVGSADRLARALVDWLSTAESPQ